MRLRGLEQMIVSGARASSDDDSSASARAASVLALRTVEIGADCLERQGPSGEVLSGCGPLVTLMSAD